MDMNVGTKLCGFAVTRIREIPGKAAQLVEMIYEKTQTELIWVKSSEQNKLFSIAFKTLPEDSTGVFHILEHSVLCGSEKYPVKEPFVELMKSSMNTFLNAMTFPDKTLYPVSSRNEQDYLNLTSVYLDAVFAPKILTNPNIFYQEGWHYETDGENLTYNGVVFNEMKGAMSSVDGVVSQAMQQMLFPDTSYGHCSGGAPDAIPDLTYEQFLDAYRKNYHPSNARIYLDGDIPLEKTLSLLEGYLSRFSLGSRQELTLQTPKADELTISYESAPEEDLPSKAQLMLGKIIGTWADKTNILAAHVLCDVLAGSNDAPLKRGILGANLGQEVTMQLNDGVFQPWLTLRVHNMDDNNAGRIRDLLREVVRALVEKGFDKQELIASINRLEFQMKDMQEPQGLIRCMNAMDSWLYGGDPMLYLSYDESFDALRKMAQSGGFEKLLEKLLLDETDLCVLHAIPSVALGEETRAKEAARLASERSAMTEDQLRAVNARSEALRAWQQTPDSPEVLASLPVLSLKEISDEPADLATCCDEVSGVTVLRHEAGTNGIIHLTAYFSLTDLSLQELTAASFLSTLLGKLPTKNHSAASLQNQIKTHLGNLDFYVDVFSKVGQTEACTPCLCAQCSVLKENLPIAETLLSEILTSTDFHQPHRIREVLLQTEMEARQMAMMNGHRFAAMCAQAHFSAQNAVSEAVNAYSRIRWLHSFAKDFDGQIDGFIGLSGRIMASSVCASRLTVSITEDSETDLGGFIEKFSVGTAVAQDAAYETALPKKLGIRIPAQVSYACTGYHLSRCKESYNGTIRLLGNILSLSYLWNAVRVQGGAYGAGMQSGRGGSLFCYSYRDPSPARTLRVYRGMADFVKTFRESGENLDKFIISTIAGTEPLVSPRQQGAIADQRWFAGLKREDAVRERRELLHATQDDLLHWCHMLNAMARDGAACVVGHSDALNACQDENLTIVDL